MILIKLSILNNALHQIFIFLCMWCLPTYQCVACCYYLINNKRKLCPHSTIYSVLLVHFNIFNGYWDNTVIHSRHKTSFNM